MLQLGALSYVVIFWILIYICDLFLKLNGHYSTRYFSFIINNGVIISLGQIRWYTTKFNNFINTIGSSNIHILKTWFDCGIVFSLVTLIASLYILIKMISNNIFGKHIDQQILTPVMPGVNLPVNQLGYYLLTLLICGILHEIGHAIAAVREGVKINGFGIFLVILYPGAFVDVSTDHINSIHPWRQLRIYCAGVWHNLALVMLAISTLVMMPILYSPLYKTQQGVIVTFVNEDSIISGTNGLNEMDIILRINKCSVSSLIDWSNCINKIIMEPNLGYCLKLSKTQKNNNLFKNSDKQMVDCCLNESDSHICFSYLIDASYTRKYACLSARATIENRPCHSNRECFEDLFVRNSIDVDQSNFVCVTPLADNITKLLSVGRLNQKNMLFFGNPLHLFYSVSVSNYIPKFKYFPLHLPYVLETFAKYIISLSGALAIFNVVPCYALDGQWITFALVDMIFSKSIQKKLIRTRISYCIIFTGTILVALNIIFAFRVLFGI